MAVGERGDGEDGAGGRGRNNGAAGERPALTDAESAMRGSRELYRGFDPVAYHRAYYSEVDLEVQFFLKQLHGTFSRGLWSESGREVLDIGCGPTIAAVLSASAWANSITMADLVQENRDAVSAWLAKADVRLDWTPHLEYVAALEGGGLTPTLLADRVRGKVKHVLPADVLSDHPLGPVAADRRYDVVISSLCLEFAAADPDQYRQVVKNVASLVKGGGHLIMQGALGNTFYLVDGTRYPSVALTRLLVEHALGDAGLVRTSWQQIARQCSSAKTADHTGCFFVVARKPE